jgi:transcriptional regulatory protein RtcR
MSKKNVVIGLLGSTLDAGDKKRWDRWRPTVSLCQHEDFLVHRLELLYPPRFEKLARTVVEDIGKVSPGTTVVLHAFPLEDPWNLEQTYAALHDFARGYPFQVERENYLVHITTGTHIAQISMFLLTEARYFPAQLIQTSPARGGNTAGTYSVIDLDLSTYDKLASRFQQERADSVSLLKGGIVTRNPAFNRMMEELEHVALASQEPILLTGPTGAGKSQLARRIHELKKSKRQVKGDLVDVNCATLRGDSAMSALFGHVRGAFTGSAGERAGFLKRAHEGVLFLDEIGELGLDEQAMLLRALEEKTFLPLGADREQHSDFLLIAGTNKDLFDAVGKGLFREDLLARINLWTFRLPSLKERPQDMEPNLDFELQRAGQRLNMHITFSKEAREEFIQFARAPDSTWSGNFRDLNAAVIRMATLAKGGRISSADVRAEGRRLKESWRRTPMDGETPSSAVDGVLGKRAAELDRFDRVQLADVLAVCAESPTLSAAGRTLFAASRAKRSSVNDADRLRKYLARFELEWSAVHGR